jgi:hypothetical protein
MDETEAAVIFGKLETAEQAIKACDIGICGCHVGASGDPRVACKILSANRVCVIACPHLKIVYLLGKPKKKLSAAKKKSKE